VPDPAARRGRPDGPHALTEKAAFSLQKRRKGSAASGKAQMPRTRSIRPMWARPAQSIMPFMFNDHLLRTLSRTRVDDARRAARDRHAEARGGPTPRLAAVASSQDAPLTIRHAAAADMRALERLAALDSHRIPSGELFVAEVEGRLVAAVSIDTGAVIADPFEPTASIVRLLRLQTSAVGIPTPRPVAVAAAEPTLPKAA
jgi:hypothetical protein